MSKRRTPHRYVWRLGPLFRQDIYCTGSADLYLRRWGLRLPGDRAVYLHKFIRPDIDVYHDHPWDFSSLILRGGYMESSCGRDWNTRAQACDHGRIGVETFKFFGALQWNHHDAEDLHYIKTIEPNTWTLVFRGRRRREWGFVVEDGSADAVAMNASGWMDWRTYLQTGGRR